MAYLAAADRPPSRPDWCSLLTVAILIAAKSPKPSVIESSYRIAFRYIGETCKKLRGMAG